MYILGKIIYFKRTFKKKYFICEINDIFTKFYPAYMYVSENKKAIDLSPLSS